MNNKEYMKKYYIEHKNDENYIRKRKEYSEKYVRPQESIERHKQKNKEWQKRNKQHILEYQREYRKRHKEQILKKDKEWKMNNLEKVKEYQQRDYKKRANDPILRLERNIRNNVNLAFRKKGFKKSERLKNMLGMEINDFVLYLLETFKNNYGYEWDRIEPVHIDHIIPLLTANTEEEVIKLFYYSNLQLLKAKDNLSKNDSLKWSISDKKWEHKIDNAHNIW